jgi:hypothetical protein
VSRAIRDHGGYTLMPEWGTHPANHYLPRRRIDMRVEREQLVRADNPLRKDRQVPLPAIDEPALDDSTSW